MNIRSLFIMVLIAVPAPAFALEELLCSYNVKVGDKFKLVASDSLTVLRGIQSDSSLGLPADHPSDIAAIMCLRDSAIPVATDKAVLVAGYGLYLSGALGGKALISLDMVNGAVVASLVSGTLSKKEKSQLEAAIAKMNEK